MTSKIPLYRNLAVGFVSCMLIGFSVMILRPLPAVSLKNCVRYSGVVTSLFTGDSGDIVIKLKDDQKYYYINRGVERLSLVELRQKLTGKSVELLAIKQWTPLEPTRASKHVAQIKVDGSIVYNEIN